MVAMKLEIETTRQAVSLVLTVGTYTVQAWADAAGAANVGGLLGVSLRTRGEVVGVELLGAARLRERLGEVPGRLVRVFRESTRRPDLLSRVMLDILDTTRDSPVGLRQRLARQVALHLAPWARVETRGENVEITVPRWLPTASVRALERRVLSLVRQFSHDNDRRLSLIVRAES